MFTLFENHRKIDPEIGGWNESSPQIGGYIEQCSRFRGVSKAGKACEKPAKGGFRNFGSPEIGVLSKGGNEHIRVP